MAPTFTPVREDKDIKQLACMADEIWHEYWPAIIGEAQTDYMVDVFQSYDALRSDIQEKAYEYWFLVDEGRTVGYTGGHDEPETNRFFMSKLYLYANERGKGYASKAFEFYEKLCAERGFGAMYLSVNKHNEMGLRAYRRKGFEVIEEVQVDIGQGFIMDDYVMQKTFES